MTSAFEIECGSVLNNARGCCCTWWLQLALTLSLVLYPIFVPTFCFPEDGSMKNNRESLIALRQHIHGKEVLSSVVDLALAENADLANAITKCLSTSPERPSTMSHAPSVVAESEKWRINIHKTRVIVERRGSDGGNWKQSWRAATDADQLLRNALIKKMQPK